MSNLHREECNHILEWEKIEGDVSAGRHTYRANVIGGWLIRFVTTHPQDVSHLFLSDPHHYWGTGNQYPEVSLEETNYEEVPQEILIPDNTPELTEGEHQNPSYGSKRKR